jgi:mannose-6-phosphate isomerase-like protein (cupin superfamily)
MSDHTIARIDEMETAFGGALYKARAALGVRAFGMAVEEFPPSNDQYPEHDHSGDGQEEVYIVVRGGGEIELDGERFAIDTETFVRVGPGVRRRLLSGPEGMRVVALGGVPGVAYEPPAYTEAGA